MHYNAFWNTGCSFYVPDKNGSVQFIFSAGKMCKFGTFVQQTTPFKCIPGEFVVRFIRYVCSKSHKSNNHFYNRCSLHTVVVEICIACSKSVFKNTILSQIKRAWYFICQQHCESVNMIERAWYFIHQQHCESVNIETFDQSEHSDGMADCQRHDCLQACHPFPLPHPVFCLLPTAEPGLRLLFRFGFCLCLRAKPMKKINSFTAYNFSAKYKISWSSQGKSESSEAIAFS